MTNAWSVSFRSLRKQGDVLHGWGALKGRGRKPALITLEIESAEDHLSIPVFVSKTNYTPGTDGLRLDFSVYGKDLNQSAINNKYSFKLTFADSTSETLPAPSPVVLVNHGLFYRLRRLPWAHYIERAVLLIRAHQFKVLWDAFITTLKSYIHFTWSSRPRPIKHPQSMGLTLVIDHSMGGGANTFRGTLEKEIVAHGSLPVLFTFLQAELEYQVSFTMGKRRHAYRFPDLNSVTKFVQDQRINSIIFNNIASFPEPLRVIRWLSRYIFDHSSIRFIVMLHDYLSICPSRHLLNKDGHFCGIPDITICENCISTNVMAIPGLARGVNIESWREAWLALLGLAHELRTFSNSSKFLLVRAYPSIPRELITTIPHVLAHALLRPVKVINYSFPIIGVIGALNFAKGGSVILDLARYITERKKPHKIVLIGTSEYDLPNSVATVTGFFHPNQLPDLLEKHCVNICLFPSICPETFSYVTEEIIQMKMPLVTFDLGAPAERVRPLKFGKVLPLTDSENVLTAIDNLFLLRYGTVGEGL